MLQNIKNFMFGIEICELITTNSITTIFFYSQNTHIASIIKDQGKSYAKYSQAIPQCGWCTGTYNLGNRNMQNMRNKS